MERDSAVGCRDVVVGLAQYRIKVAEPQVLREQLVSESIALDQSL